MKYKLIASDFDGTLSRDDHTISEYTKDVIREYRARGGIFVVATGRSAASCEHAYKQLGITDDVPAISFQGALIRNSVSKRVIRQTLVPESAALSALEAFKDDYLQVYQNEEIYRNKSNSQFADMYGRVTKTIPIYVESLAPYALKSPKLLVAEFSNGFYDRLEIYRAQNMGIVDMDFTRGEMLEIYSVLAGKGNAVKYLAEQVYGFAAENVLGFGDSRNDISLIKYAGHGVAVASYEGEEVAAAANFICESNQADGVAKTIERLCL